MTRDTDLADRPATQADEIELTPEMLAAGLAEVPSDVEFVGPHEVRRIFFAMVRAHGRLRPVDSPRLVGRGAKQLFVAHPESR